MNAGKKTDTGFEAVGDILKGAIQQWLDQSQTPVSRIWSLWETVVGENIAQNAQPAFLKSEVLVVHVTSSTWIQQLRYLKKDIIDNINGAAGQFLISDITFKIGDLSS